VQKHSGRKISAKENASVTEIILGPPGTGKTTSLLAEVEKELDTGTPPDRIGYVTFTRKGAEEAITRACKKFSLTAKQLPHFRTLHSLCYRALDVHEGDLLVGKVFFEFANHAGIRVTGRSWSDDGLLKQFEDGDRALFMENLSRIRQTPLREQYNANPDGLNWNYVDRVARTLSEFKLARGLLDYTDMLLRFVAEDRDLGLQKLFVDEAQDLSALQWAVVNLLARSCDRVVVAGDDDQAIYRWAGADVEHLIALDGQVRVLGQSYRCPPAVQALSDSIISEVTHRRPKQWKAKVGGPGVITRSNAFEGVDIDVARSVLILARNNYVLEEQVEPVLRAEGIVYEIAGKSSIDAEMVEAARSWTTLGKGQPITLAEARRMYKHISANKGVKKGFKTLPTYGEDDDIPVTMNDLIQTGGLKVDPKLIWHDALDRLPKEDMSYMLAALRRGEKLRDNAIRVKLSTIHSAKGGEADHVVLCREMAKRTHQEMFSQPDDERRVWYVGVTRARERLSIVSGQTGRDCPWL
jgi:DNA helicase-2/ATP-dependent DNA helicase PcrA